MNFNFLLETSTCRKIVFSGYIVIHLFPLDTGGKNDMSIFKFFNTPERMSDFLLKQINQYTKTFENL